MFKKRFRWFLNMILVGAIANICLTAAPSFEVWVVPDNVRVEPTSGRIIDANSSLFTDAYTGDYRTANTVWNREQDRITLRAARNEIIAFQLVVERTSDEPLKSVRITLSDLVAPGGQTIPAEELELFKEWYVKLPGRSDADYSLGRGWYPDALLPCQNWSGRLYPSSYIHPFDLPDLMNHIGPAHRYQAMWVDLYVPREVPPGVYEGTARIESKAQRKILSIRLEVWDFALPDETHLAGNIHSDTDLNVMPEELELKYYQMIRRHRLALGVLGYSPDIEVEEDEVHFDWQSYDQRLGKYLDGSAFTDRYGYKGPGVGVPIELLVLPFDAYPVNLYKYTWATRPIGKEFKFYRPWPVPVPEGGPTEAYEEIWKAAYKGFERHLQEKGWTRTRPIVFFLSLDEAYEKEFYEKMAFYGRLLEESGADSFQFRIDGWYPPEAMQELAPYVDIAILGAGGFQLEEVEQLRKKGIEDWIYMGAGNIDQTISNGRALGWVCWKNGVSSWTLWELDFNALRAYIDPVSYVSGSDRAHHGHGMLVYRGETMGLDQPVSSIRLKMMRRGSQDYEYLWLLSRDPGMRAQAARIVDSIIHDALGNASTWGSPGMWSHNSEEWEKARINLGNLVAEMKSSGE